MNDQESAAVIAALESGRQFTFEAYTADARESLDYDRASDRFVLRTRFAYDPDADRTETFTREELAARLREGFEYGSFGLPRPLAGRPTTCKGGNGSAANVGS
jgi:hypothetical protein